MEVWSSAPRGQLREGAKAPTRLSNEGPEQEWGVAARVEARLRRAVEGCGARKPTQYTWTALSRNLL